MDQESQELYDYLFGDEKKILTDKLAAQAATIDAQAAALSDKNAALSAKDELLARYQALYGPLPSQQPPAAPQA